MRQFVTRLQPDVLEIHSPYVAAAAGLSLSRSQFGIRTFVWHADFIDTYLRGGLEERTKAFGALGPRLVDGIVEPLWAWVRAITRGCDATFVASKFQVDKLMAHGAERIVHLPFGIERDIFGPERRDATVRARLLDGRDGPLVVAIGRLAVEKRWDVVLDGYVRFARRFPQARLVVMGDGPERDRMKARVDGRSDVRFCGFERDRAALASILASADLLIHGCPFETFGLGVAEAIASGLPAVLPDQGGAAEQASGPSVRLYPSGDAEALAAAAATLMNQPANELRAHALEAAAAVPSLEQHFDALFAHYQRLLAERRA